MFTQRCLGSLLLASVLTLPIASSGCAARVRVYDRDHNDYHRWNDREDQAYRRYLNEKQESYRDYKSQDADKQRDYWKWRHDHPDNR